MTPPLYAPHVTLDVLRLVPAQAAHSAQLDVPTWTCQIGPTKFEHTRSMMPKFRAASGNPGMAVPVTWL